MTTPTGARRPLVPLPHPPGLGRRAFLQQLAAVGLVPAGAAALAACSEESASAPETSEAAATDGAASGDPTVATGEVPGPPWEGGVRGGTGVAVWQDDSLVLDPPLAYGTGDYYCLQNFYRGLMFLGLDAEPQLDMAEAVEISDDGLEYTFTLREGITFHNGRACTAADVKYTFERSSSPDIASWVQNFLSAVEGHEAFVAGEADEITGITAPDDRTLTLTLTRPDVTILLVVAIPPFYVLPQEEVEAAGDDWPQRAVGTGPYVLADYDGGNRTLTLERFDGYIWGDRLPYFDTIEWKWGIGPDLQYLQVDRGEADATVQIPPAAVEELSADSAKAERLQDWNSLSLFWFEFDVTAAPFDDPLVRQAVNHALDPAKMEPIGFVITKHFWPAGLLGYDESLPVYDYDLDRARDLLDEAGASGVSIKLGAVGTSDPRFSRAAQVLAQDLEAIGFTVEIVPSDESIYDLGTDARGQFNLWTKGWGMGLPDPSELTASLIGTDAPSNFGGYGNPQIDELAAQAIAETDRDARAELYREMERILVEDAPFVFAGVDTRYTYTSERLRNFVWEPALWAYWDRLWAEE
jgi:peptide/nickel transport system substrate-binding protein/oligopeptide transport system substrate-binding protein